VNTASVRIAVAAAVFLGFLARAATFQAPLFDFHSWRQADTATIARNFTRDRFDPIRPEIDARGMRTDGTVETGLELMAILAAVAAKGVGFSTHLGRLISACAFPFAAVLLYRFTRDRYGERVGLVTAWIYSFGLPLSMFMDRAFMNESLLALLSIVSLRAAQQYVAGRRLHFATLVVASTLLGLIKPPYLVVWAPIAGLFIERHGWRALFRVDLLLGVAVNLVAVFLWFRHAHAIFVQNALSFGISNNMFSVETLTSVEYWQVIFSHLSRDVFTPLVLALALYGLVRSLAMRRWAEGGGAVGFLVYLFVVTEGNRHQNYYQLVIAPIGAVLAGLGIIEWVGRLAALGQWREDRRAIVTAILVSVCVFSTFIRSASFHSWYEVDSARLRLCQDLGPTLKPQDRVAFIGTFSPDVLFCLDHRGWLYSETTPANELRYLATAPADVVIAPDEYRDLLKVFADVPQQTLLESPGFVAIRFLH
jgi:hypothetical protein